MIFILDWEIPEQFFICEKLKFRGEELNFTTFRTDIQVERLPVGKCFKDIYSA